MTSTITVLVPVVKAKIKEVNIVARVSELNNKVIGFLWNRKPNGEILLKEFEQQLSKRFHLAGTKWYERNIGVPIDAGILDEIARSCDIVVNAVAD